MYGSMESPLKNSIVQYIDNYVPHLIQRGAISQFTGTELRNHLMNNLEVMFNSLRTNYPSGVPAQALEMMVADMARQIILQIQQTQQVPMVPPGGMFHQMQPQQTSMFRTVNPAPQNTFMQESYTSKPGVQPQQMQPLQKPVAIVPQPEITSSVVRVLKSANPVHQYTSNYDNKCTELSVYTETGPILDIITRSTIKNEIGETFTYLSGECHIPEPSIRQVIMNFLKTNQRLLKDEFIASMRYNRFRLKETPLSKSPLIDVSSLKTDQMRDLPVDMLIKQVTDSIGDRKYNIASVIQELIKEEFVDRLQRYVRSLKSIDTVLIPQFFEDINTIASLRNEEFKELVYHKNYAQTILRCFREAVQSVITENTREGYWPTSMIVSHMIASPNFVIRDVALCEREMDTGDNNFINAVESRYTAFANDGNIVISNHIPKDLESDLTENSIMLVETPTNVFEYLLSAVWSQERDTTKTIVLFRDLDKPPVMVIKNGKTLDGEHFFYRSSIDWDFN